MCVKKTVYDIYVRFKLMEVRTLGKNKPPREFITSNRGRKNKPRPWVERVREKKLAHVSKFDKLDRCALKLSQVSKSRWDYLTKHDLDHFRQMPAVHDPFRLLIPYQKRQNIKKWKERGAFFYTKKEKGKIMDNRHHLTFVYGWRKGKRRWGEGET